MYQLYRDWPRFILAVVFANFVLSAWSIMLDSVINNDGITYVTMADLYLKGDWQTAQTYYNWPVYPALIAALAKLLFLDTTSAAHLLNTLFATSMTLAFVAVVGELSGNNRRVLLIAALIILLFPSITKYRAYIIRDFGYLSFYLWSLYFLFRFCSTLNKKHLVGWLSATALGCLFRFEGIIFLLVAPYFLFVFSTKHIRHRRKILATLSLSIFAISTVIISYYLQDKYQTSVTLAQQAGKDIHNVFDLLFSNIRDQLGQDQTGAWSYAAPFLSTTGSVFYDLVRRMAVVYFFISLFAFYKGLGLSTPLIKRVWLVYLITNVLLLLGFSITNNLTVSRYTLATSLTLLLLAPFAVDYIWQRFSQFGGLQRFLVQALIVIIVLVSFKNLDVRSNKAHLITAGDWLATNLPDDTRLFSNDRILVHYAKQGPKSNFVDQFTNARMHSHLQTNIISHYDFVALSVTNKNQQEKDFDTLLAKKYGAPLQTVTGNDGRTVSIYTTKAQYQHLTTVN